MSIISAINKAMLNLGYEIGEIPIQITLNEEVFDTLYQEEEFASLRIFENIPWQNCFKTQSTQIQLYVIGFGTLRINRGNKV